jgi:hypothetical protein
MEDRREAPARGGKEMTAEERESRGKRDSLEMSRRRIERELSTASSETHRTALEHALHHLDGELSRLR